MVTCESNLSREEVDLGRRSIRAISKGMIRTFQTTVQKNGRSNVLVLDNAPVSTVSRPPLQRIASHTGITDSGNGGFSSVNDKLSRMYSRPRSDFPKANSDRGIYSSRAMRSWGSTVSAEMSTFATIRVMPLFRRQNTDPAVSIGSLSEGRNDNEISFDYQLMKDGERSI